MLNIICTRIVCFSLLLVSCKNPYNLKDTKWLTVKFEIDSKNYLSDLERNVLSNFDTSIKLHMNYTDSLALAFVEGRKVDTSVYKIKDYTLYHTQSTLI